MTYYEELMKLRGLIAERDKKIQLLTRVAEAVDKACDCGLAPKCCHKRNYHVELYTAVKAWRESEGK